MGLYSSPPSFYKKKENGFLRCLFLHLTRMSIFDFLVLLIRMNYFYFERVIFYFRVLKFIYFPYDGRITMVRFGNLNFGMHLPPINKLKPNLI
jgi:hypothetical protein